MRLLIIKCAFSHASKGLAITKTRLFKYIENFPTKKWKILGKIFFIFFIFLLKT